MHWLVQKIEEYAERRHQRSGPLSAAWLSVAPAAARGLSERVRSLREIRDIVRNFVRVGGAPQNCRIKWANLADMGAGAAGFDDAPESFDRPFILLDRHPFDTCDPAEVVDTYCGIGLHEKGHIDHTRDFYRRIAAGLSGRRRVWENLLEDERIEERIRHESPGFSSFLDVAREVLLDRQQLGKSLKSWDELPDLDKVNALIFTFLRSPYLLTPATQAWAAVNGECVFQTLFELFPTGPVSERDVIRGGAKLEELFRRLAEHYSASALEDARQAAQRGEPGAADSVERIARELAADRADREENQQPGDLRLDTVGVLSKTDDGKVLRDGRAWRRFSLRDMDRILNQLDRIHTPLDDAEEAELSRQEDPLELTGDRWDWGSDRKTMVEFPRPDDSAREHAGEAARVVQPHVAAMRSVLRLRLGTRVVRERQKEFGQLDRRMLGRVMATRSIYYRSHERSDQGLALCLLLDESGSMRHYGRSTAALQVAVLMARALRGAPGIELEIYSHTSTAGTMTDCVVRYLYGAKNSDLATLGCYGAGFENYDHQAILTAARLFRANTRNSNRVMLVVSDGLPGGVKYGGEPAIRATREAVDAIRRQGIDVRGVALAKYGHEQIYGTRNLVHFTDLGSFVADMRKLVTRLVRQVTERG